SLERRSTASVVQIVALALGFMALLLLTVTRNDLLEAWQRAIPPDAANRFVVNIQPEQLGQVRQAFAREALAADFAPMIRGRLARVNGREVGPDDYPDERAKRLIDREFNLSYRSDLPQGNAVVAGRWFSPTESERGMASVEDGLAKTLGLKLGDRLEFVVAGEKVEMQVLNLRKLNWDSMRVNFFVLTQPAVLQAYPASWITSFHLGADQAAFVNRLIGEFPNLTVIDVAAIVRQLRAIMDQVAQAVQFVFLFTLLAGVIVLYAALASAAEERRYELAVMRALGARREQLRRALLAEFAAVGGLAGLIASLGAIGVGQVLASKAFQFDVPVNLWLPLFAAVGGALLVMGAGWFAAARLINAPPLEALRAG
ncbi:MAG: FtsX-like permease family protein, partial [Betaproteobacteria bacterium]